MFFQKTKLALSVVAVITVSSANAAGFLYFPIEGYNIWSVPISAIPDLDVSSKKIQIFTGEKGAFENGCIRYFSISNVRACVASDTPSQDVILGYKKTGGGDWNVGGLPYRDDYSATRKTYMFYDNHRAYDFPVPSGKWVGAAATGKLVEVNLNYGQLKLEHVYNGETYQTIYTHMALNPAATALIGKTVPAFTRLGQVSNVGTGGTHLHFAILKKRTDGSWAPVDAFGGPHPTLGIQPILWVN